jgi:hypothetical protein
MVYATPQNPDKFLIMTNAEMVRIRQVRGLLRLLRKVNYSVVSSRHEGHGAIDEFMSSLLWGDQVFSANLRFPEGGLDLYLSFADSCTHSTLTSLVSVLSWRSLKPQPSLSQDPRAPAVTGFSDTDLNNNTKRFEELLKTLGDLVSDNQCIWGHTRITEEVTGPWT